MKKLYLILVLLSLFILTACSGTKNYKYLLKNNLTDSKVVLTIKDDKVLNYSATTVIKPYTKSGAEGIKKFYKSYYGSLKTAKYKVTYNESTKIMTMKVDIEIAKEDINTLNMKRILNNKDVEYISIESAEEVLKEQGFKKVK